MPWKVNNVLETRMMFVLRHEAGERMSDLCREFGISRKTGHKIWNRYRQDGAKGLEDRCRRPARSPKRTSNAVVDRILALKDQYPRFGAKKLKHKLETLEPGVKWPARSTIFEILKSHGRVKTRRTRRRAEPLGLGVCRTRSPNEVWSTDFKGEFQLGDRTYCYPLTIGDHFSRHLLGCEGLESVKGVGARVVFEEVFREYGLPNAMLSDNGVPFATTGLFGLSELSVWWLKLGIGLLRIEPGHPEQNGRHERMHLTLKEETTRPAAENVLAQQERFDEFVKMYNTERPHEGIGMLLPSDLYYPSSRPYPEEEPELHYPLHDFTKVVAKCGHLRLRRGSTGQVFLSRALAGEAVGLREVEEDRWLITFARLDLGYFDTRTGIFEVADPMGTSRVQEDEETDSEETESVGSEP